MGIAFFSRESNSINLKGNDALSSDYQLWCDLCSAASEAGTTFSALGAPACPQAHLTLQPTTPVYTPDFPGFNLYPPAHDPKCTRPALMPISRLAVPWSPQLT